jgi:hypothetical protein
MSAAVARRGLDRPRRERARNERLHAAVVVALGGEHQPVVPVAQRSLSDAHQVEQRQPDSYQSLVMGQ